MVQLSDIAPYKVKTESINDEQAVSVNETKNEEDSIQSSSEHRNIMQEFSSYTASPKKKFGSVIGGDDDYSKEKDRVSRLGSVEKTIEHYRTSG